MKSIEAIFAQFLDVVQILQKNLNVPFVGAVTETSDNLENSRMKVEMDAPDEETVALLSKKCQELGHDRLPSTQKYMVFTLLTLKATKEDGRNYSQAPTPPVLATVVAMVWDRLVTKTELAIVDPAIGTGSLLYTIIGQLVQSHRSQNKYRLAGIDNDESMLDLADVEAHLSNYKIDSCCQDALENWLIEKPDITISDLPAGCYPIDENAKNFATQAKEGHSLARELLVEQTIKNLAPVGYTSLLVPSSLLGGKLGAEFMPWLVEKVYLQAVVQLSNDLFQNPLNQKPLLVFRNHNEGARSRDVLLAKLGSLKEEKSLVDFNQKLNE